MRAAYDFVAAGMPSSLAFLAAGLQARTGDFGGAILSLEEQFQVQSEAAKAVWDSLAVGPQLGYEDAYHSALLAQTVTNLGAGGYSLLRVGALGLDRALTVSVDSAFDQLTLFRASLGEGTTLLPSEAEVMQGVVNDSLARLAANPAMASRLLSARELDAVKNEPWRTPMAFGDAMERDVAFSIADVGLDDYFKWASKPGVATPDFVSLDTGTKFDVTTDNLGTILKHLTRPYGQDMVIVPYRRPYNFSFK